MKFISYPKYFLSGSQWILKIPNVWEVKPLKKIFLIINGSTPKSSLPEYWDGEINWFTPDDLGSNTKMILYESRRKISEEGYDSCGVKIAPASSLALSTRAPIGHLAIIGNPGCVNQGCRLLVPMLGNSVFLYYLLFAAKEELISYGQGSTFYELSRTNLGKIPLPFPPLEEQQSIAAFLDYKTKQIDDLIEKKEQLLKFLEEKRIALITQAVTKGLDSNVKMKSSGIDWLGDIPAHWEVKRLKFLVDLVNEKIESDIADYPYMGLENIESWTGNRIETTEYTPEGTANLFTKDDVLFGKLRPYLAKAYLAEENGICTTETLVLRSKNEILPQFLLHYLLTHFFIDVVNSRTFGAKMPRASWEFIGSMLVTAPPKAEQNIIAQKIKMDLNKIIELYMRISSAIEKLKEYRTSLITSAVTGKIDLRNWQNPSLSFTRRGIEGEVQKEKDELQKSFKKEL